jgi:hypothetical protein
MSTSKALLCINGSNKKRNNISVVSFSLTRRRLTLPGPCGPSTISTGELNFCVRYGNRCSLSVIVARLMNCDYLTFHLVVKDVLHPQNCTILFIYHQSSLRCLLFRSSPRPISIGQLRTLLHLHLRPINHVVYMGSYQPTLWEILS